MNNLGLSCDRELDDKLDRDVLRERVSGIEDEPERAIDDWINDAKGEDNGNAVAT